MQTMVDVKNLDRTIEAVARLYREITGMEIQPSKAAEIPPEKEPVAFVSERYAQLLTTLAARPAVSSELLPGATGRAVPLPWVPPVDIYETENEVLVLVDLPGVSEGDWSVLVVDNTLVLRSERRPEPVAEGAAVRLSERPLGHYQRLIPLPVRVRGDKVDAKSHDGVITMRLERDTPANRARMEREATAAKAKKP